MKTDSVLVANSGLLAFVHIPKTAGTTLNSTLAHQYSPEQTLEVMMRGMSWIVPGGRIIPKPLISFSKIYHLTSTLKKRHTLRLIRGHFDMSLIKFLPVNTQFFTLMRDPVERAISHYYHYRNQSIDPIHSLAISSTLAEWVSTCGLVEMDNGQTRRLAGEMNLPCGRVTLQMLERAKSNLANKFTVVGLTERFDESLILLHRTFNWPPYRYPARNVGDNRSPRTMVSKEVIKIIESYNYFDLKLYQFASELFEQAVSKIDMAGELSQLRNVSDSGEPGR